MLGFTFPLATSQSGDPLAEFNGEFAALDKRLGREVALASAYNLLHRHDWRKLAPDKRHPQSDQLAQEEWKKNSPSVLPKSAKTGRKAKPSS